MKSSMTPRFVDLFGYVSLLSRAGTLIFQSMVLGGVLFLLWVTIPAPYIPETTCASIRSRCSQLLRISAIGLAVAQGVSLYLDSVVLMWTVDIRFSDVIGATFFVAGVCIVIAAICIFCIANAATGVRSFGLLALAVIILSASAIGSHAAARVNGRPLLLVVTFLHEAAAGLWIGGLPFLILSLRTKHHQTQWLLASRFSRAAVLCVSVLLGSGLALSLAYIGRLDAILGTAYGVMVTAKAAMFGVLALVGAINFFLLRNAAPQAAVPKLRSLVEAEFGIGLAVILTAVTLTSHPPAVDLQNEVVSPHAILARLSPSWPRLTYPRPISSYSDGSPMKEAQARSSMVKDADGKFLSYKQLADIGESEANHHWMGLIVLAMGILALLARAGKFPWARYWPLLLICISVFIFLRADTESWPFGSQGFWAVWLHAEVFQHRLAALFCAGFAVFELRARNRGVDNPSFAMVFPILCALGGAVLLTHSHSVTNTKEQLLTELSHVPLGIFAILAGWSRWLEIRMPIANRRLPSLIWPVCFLLIAAGLLNYREL